MKIGRDLSRTIRQSSCQSVSENGHTYPTLIQTSCVDMTLAPHRHVFHSLDAAFTTGNRIAGKTAETKKKTRNIQC